MRKQLYGFDLGRMFRPDRQPTFVEAKTAVDTLVAEDLGNCLILSEWCFRLSPADFMNLVNICGKYGIDIFLMNTDRSKEENYGLIETIYSLPYCLGGIVGERAGVLHWRRHIFVKGVPQSITDLETQFREHYTEAIGKLKRHGAKACVGMEVTPVGHKFACQAGVDFIMAEHAGNICTSSASARGMARAFNKPIWGNWINIGYYGGGQGGPSDDTRGSAHVRRLAVDLSVAYVSGSRFLCVQDSLFGDWISSFFDPTCSTSSADATFPKALRNVAKNAWQLMRSNPLSERGPETTVAVMHGNGDSAPAMFDLFDPEEFTWGCSHAGEDWRYGGAERGWAALNELLPAENKRIARYSSTPFGPIDIIPASAGSDTLKRYNLIVLLGWNTMTPSLYANLKSYVHSGGTLFLTPRHLCINTKRGAAVEFYRGGDYRNFLGARVLNKGESIRQVCFKGDKGSFSFNKALIFKRFISFRTPLHAANAELDSAEVLAYAGGSDSPILLCNRVGNGTVYVLLLWEFLGDAIEGFSLYDNKRSCSFVGYILRQLARKAMSTRRVEGKNLVWGFYDTKSREKQLAITRIDWDHANKTTSALVYYDTGSEKVKLPPPGKVKLLRISEARLTEVR